MPQISNIFTLFGREVVRLRWPLLGLICGAVIIGGAVGAALPVFVAKTYVSFPSLDVDLYQRLAPILRESGAIARYFMEDGDDPERRRIRFPLQFPDESIKLLWPPSEMRKVAPTRDPKVILPVALGVSLSGSVPEQLERELIMLVGGVADILYVRSLNEFYRARVRELDQAVLTIENRRSGLERDLISNEMKIKALQVIQAKYPDLSSNGGRQILDVKGEGSKYLPISTQIVAAEAIRVEITDEQNRAALQLKEADTQREYYKAAQNEFTSVQTAAQIQARTSRIRERLFTPERRTDSSVAEAYRNVQEAELAKISEFRFFIESVNTHKRFGMTYGLAIAGGVSGLISVLVLLIALVMRHPEIYGISADNS